MKLTSTIKIGGFLRKIGCVALSAALLMPIGAHADIASTTWATGKNRTLVDWKVGTNVDLIPTTWCDIGGVPGNCSTAAQLDNIRVRTTPGIGFMSPINKPSSTGNYCLQLSDQGVISTTGAACAASKVYSVTAPINLTGVNSDIIGHDTSIAAGTVGPSGNVSISAGGGSFIVPEVTYNAYGHLTATAGRTITVPALTTNVALHHVAVGGPTTLTDYGVTWDQVALKDPYLHNPEAFNQWTINEHWHPNPNTNSPDSIHIPVIMEESFGNDLFSTGRPNYFLGGSGLSFSRQMVNNKRSEGWFDGRRGIPYQIAQMNVGGALDGNAWGYKMEGKRRRSILETDYHTGNILDTGILFSSELIWNVMNIVGGDDHMQFSFSGPKSCLEIDYYTGQIYDTGTPCGSGSSGPSYSAGTGISFTAGPTINAARAFNAAKTSTVSTNTYALTNYPTSPGLVYPAFSAADLIEGAVVFATVHTNITGGTLNVGGTGARSILLDGMALGGSPTATLYENGIYSFTYGGGAWNAKQITESTKAFNGELTNGSNPSYSLVNSYPIFDVKNLVPGTVIFGTAHANLVGPNATLNVGVTGAKPLFQDGSALNTTTNTIKLGSVYSFTYDGTNWNAKQISGAFTLPVAQKGILGGIQLKDSSTVAPTLSAANVPDKTTSPDVIGKIYPVRLTPGATGNVNDDYVAYVSVPWEGLSTIVFNSSNPVFTTAGIAAAFGDSSGTPLGYGGKTHEIAGLYHKNLFSGMGFRDSGNVITGWIIALDANAGGGGVSGGPVVIRDSYGATCNQAGFSTLTAPAPPPPGNNPNSPHLWPESEINGVWHNVYTYCLPPQATKTKNGTVKLGSDTIANGFATPPNEPYNPTGSWYPVQVNAANQMFVNVPSGGPGGPGGEFEFMKGGTSTAVATAAKDVALLSPNNAHTPAIGDVFAIWFEFGNTADNPTLNINTSGAKDLTTTSGNRRGDKDKGALYVEPESWLFVYYNGTKYISLGATDNTTYKSFVSATAGAIVNASSPTADPFLNLVADGASAPVSSHKISGLNGVNVTGNAGNITLSGTMYDLWVGSQNSSGTAALINPWLNFFQNGSAKQSYRMIGDGSITVKSDTSGNITITNFDRGSLIDCSDALANSSWYVNANGSGSIINVNQMNQFVRCSCDRATNYVDFSVRMTVGRGSPGTFIARGDMDPYTGAPYTVGCQPTNQLDTHPNRPYNGCKLADNLPFYPVATKGDESDLQPAEIICDIEATGLEKGSFGYFMVDPDNPYNPKDVQWMDCNDIERIRNDQTMQDRCQTISGGVAIWGNTRADSIDIHFGDELWAFPGESTFWLKCSGRVNNCCNPEMGESCK